MNDPNGQGEHDHPGDQSGIIVLLCGIAVAQLL